MAEDKTKLSAVNKKLAENTKAIEASKASKKKVEKKPKAKVLSTAQQTAVRIQQDLADAKTASDKNIEKSKANTNKAVSNAEKSKIRAKELLSKKKDTAKRKGEAVDEYAKDVDTQEVQAKKAYEDSVKRAEAQARTIDEAIAKNTLNKESIEQKKQELEDDIEASGVDPDRWFNSRSTGQTVAYYLGAMFSGADGSSAEYFNTIDKSIQKDINAQMTNLQSKEKNLARLDTLSGRLQANLKTLRAQDINVDMLRNSLEQVYYKNVATNITNQYNAQRASFKTEEEANNAESIYNASLDKANGIVDKLKAKQNEIEIANTNKILKVAQAQQAVLDKANLGVDKKEKVTLKEKEEKKRQVITNALTKGGAIPTNQLNSQKNISRITPSNGGKDAELTSYFPDESSKGKYIAEVTEREKALRDAEKGTFLYKDVEKNVKDLGSFDALLSKFGFSVQGKITNLSSKIMLSVLRKPLTGGGVMSDKDMEVILSVVDPTSGVIGIFEHARKAITKAQFKKLKQIKAFSDESLNRKSLVKLTRKNGGHATGTVYSKGKAYNVDTDSKAFKQYNTKAYAIQKSFLSKVGSVVPKDLTKDRETKLEIYKLKVDKFRKEYKRQMKALRG